MLNETLEYTYYYKQPDEYRFSLDSLYLAQFVAAQLKSHPHLGSLRVLDLCAGCGVIGIQLSWYLRDLRQIDFVEIQDIYTDYFFQNIAQVNRPELQFNWHLMNYDELNTTAWEETFDLIISNPPYFQEGHGMLSPSEFKNRCRFYLDSSFTNYVLALCNSLRYGGKAYFLLRPLQHHGLDLFSDLQQIALSVSTSLFVKQITQIRGTDVILLEKLYGVIV